MLFASGPPRTLDAHLFLLPDHLLSAYRLYTVVPRLVKFVDVLTNWYVRMNRRRLKVSTRTQAAARSGGVWEGDLRETGVQPEERGMFSSALSF